LINLPKSRTNEAKTGDLRVILTYQSGVHLTAVGKQSHFAKASNYRGVPNENAQNVARATFKVAFQNLPNREILKFKKNHPAKISSWLSVVSCRFLVFGF
jgi:hypothetical protein